MSQQDIVSFNGRYCMKTMVCRHKSRRAHELSRIIHNLSALSIIISQWPKNNFSIVIDIRSFTFMAKINRKRP